MASAIPLLAKTPTGTKPSGAIPVVIWDLPPSTGAPIASPAFTGTPTAPTAAATTNTTQLATTQFVNSATRGKAQTVALVNAAPAAAAPTKQEFDTLVLTVNAIIAALKA